MNQAHDRGICGCFARDQGRSDWYEGCWGRAVASHSPGSWRAPVLGAFLLALTVARGAQGTPELERVFCEGRAGCALTGRIAARKAKDGTRREVWRITLPEESAHAPLEGDAECLFEEFWLVARDAAGAVAGHRFFAGGCAASSPADAWCGLPPRTKVRVRGSTVSSEWEAHALRCMSAYHSRGRSEVSLDTFEPIRQRASFYRIVPPDERTTSTWDWRALRGTRSLTVEPSACPRLAAKAIPRVPSFTVDESFVDAGWKVLDMTACSTRIDAAHGFSMGGATSTARLQVLATSDGSLIVDVASRGERALSRGTLRVCFGDGAMGSYAYCPSSEPVECSEISLAETQPPGESGLAFESAPGGRRFKIAVPEGDLAVAVAYIEPGGRSIASGPMRRATAPSPAALSELFLVDPEIAVCRVTDGALRVVFTGSASLPR